MVFTNMEEGTYEEEEEEEGFFPSINIHTIKDSSIYTSKKKFLQSLTGQAISCRHEHSIYLQQPYECVCVDMRE